MKNILIIIILSISLLGYSQSHEEIDSISFQMCNQLKTTSKIDNDSLRINDIYEKILYPYLGNIPGDKAQTVGQTIYFRFQRNCPEFREILHRAEPPKDDVSWSETEPDSRITSKEINEFKNTENFSYSEVDGKRTDVSLKNGTWIDTFSNNTFSKLTQEWISDQKFELIFIESNNLTRSNFSFKGDKLVYKLLDKNEDHYLLSVNIVGQKDYEMFKLYYK